MIRLRPLLFLPLALAASCAKDSDGGSARSAPARAPLSQRVNEQNGFKVDANGNWVPRSDKRSSFEGKGESPYFQGEYAKKEYKAGDYQKKSWKGGKEYDRLTYQGDTDGSRFQKDSRFAGQGAREAGNAADLPGRYDTGTYATGAAREAGEDAIGKPSDAETDFRRGVFGQPDVIDWRQQRALSLEQSRGILGR